MWKVIKSSVEWGSDGKNISSRKSGKAVVKPVHSNCSQLQQLGNQLRIASIAKIL
jgi:hypothetical protein